MYFNRVCLFFLVTFIAVNEKVFNSKMTPWKHSETDCLSEKEKNLNNNELINIWLVGGEVIHPFWS